MTGKLSRDKKVSLIPNNTYAALWSDEVREKEMIKGVTTGNRDVIFIRCKYNSCSLGYKVLVVASSNAGECKDITVFDRICFEGKAVNTFAGPGRTFDSEKGTDISERMKAITPKKWTDVNFYSDIKIKNQNMKLAIDYSFWHNLKHSDTSMGEAIPKFCIEFNKAVSVRKIPDVYLMTYDFFVFLNFRRNIAFDKIYIQRKIKGKFDTIATVFVNNEIYEEYSNTEHNSIVSLDCRECWGDIFKTVALRRVRKIYDNFYIPKDQQESNHVTYEKFLSCALSFESEYNRLYPSKKEENEKYAYIHNMFEMTADKLDVIFQLAQENKITYEEFEKCFYGEVNRKYKKMVKSLSKTQTRPYRSYYEKIMKNLSKIDFSLGEKYKNALSVNYDCVESIIARLSSSNNIQFPSVAEAGEIFESFRNGIAHGNPPEMKKVHCVLFEVTRALIYVMILKKAGANDKTIKNIISKLF